MMPIISKPRLDRIYIGIDPGASGGISVIYPYGSVSYNKMPSTEQDIWDYVSSIKYGSGATGRFAIIEKVGGFIGRGGVGVAVGPAMFNFGWNYGLLRMSLIAASIPFDEVPPQRWQKALGINTKARARKAKAKNVVEKKDEVEAKPKESSTQFKNRLKALAQQLYPDIKVTLATSDSLLIATYCKRRQEGTL